MTKRANVPIRYEPPRFIPQPPINVVPFSGYSGYGGKSSRPETTDYHVVDAKGRTLAATVTSPRMGRKDGVKLIAAQTAADQLRALWADVH